MDLRKFQKNSNKTIGEVAKDLNLPFSTYNNYLIGTRKPSLEILIKIANYFNVTTDELLGIKKRRSYSNRKEKTYKKD